MDLVETMQFVKDNENDHSQLFIEDQDNEGPFAGSKEIDLIEARRRWDFVIRVVQ